MTRSAIQDMPVLNEVLDMTAHSGTKSGLDPRTYFMVRIAALAATGAGPGAWAVNLGTAAEVGLTREDVQSVLVAVAPVIGTARTVAAVGSALRGVGLAAAIADTEE